MVVHLFYFTSEHCLLGAFGGGFGVFFLEDGDRSLHTKMLL